MTDYRPIIQANLSESPGIVKSPEVIEAINDALNEAECAGLGRLVENFCNNRDPDRARDFLFELYVGHMLLRNPNVRNLEYEPERETHPPDFRSSIGGVDFDIQVKRIHNVKNEMTKLLFRRECRRRLSRIAKPWFINFWVSDEFQRQHINLFFDYVRDNIDSHEAPPDLMTALEAKQYRWGDAGRTLVRYSFVKKNSGRPGIVPGVIHLVAPEGGMWPPLDIAAMRRAVERCLKASRPTLTRPISPVQSNLVVLQAAGDVELGNDEMDNILYGDEGITTALRTDGTWVQWESRSPNGLFREDRFSAICGVVLVPKSASFSDVPFPGRYFVHPRHFDSVRLYPEPFHQTRFQIPPGWERVNTTEAER